MTRLLYLVPAAGVPLLGPSGASAHVRGVTSAFASLGHDVTLLGARDVDGRGALEPPTVPWRSSGVAAWPSWLDRSRWGWMRELRTARRVAAIARRACDDGAADVELLIERHALFSDASLRLSASTGVPWILEVNAPPVRERGLRGEAVWEPAGSRWEREILRAAPRIAVVSRWLADWLVCEIGCERERVAVVPNGVPPHVGDRQATREALGLRDDDFVLGFLGSFQPWHGTEALPFLLHALPDARLLLVGSAASGILPTTEALRVFGERVLTVGRVPEPEVAHLVAAMDVGLAPYPPDAPPWFCPLKVLAYRAQGTPVVGTAIADTPTLVDGGGDVVPPGDLDALADAVAVWRGRRCAPWIRAWTEVAGELLRLGLAGHTSAG